ncbi:MAG: Uncharacterized protein G01um101470_550 [Parcubacteria group bacterium Gr01-1014_70]|nr:MAG: Uncharacterized protein G01um101470_550 [Parcubacteria group bacterium Gr01-1014_70]
MKNNLLQEIFVSLVLVVLLVLFLNPFGFWMPDALVMMMVLGLIVVFALFSGFIWKEQARDEREMLHRMLAGRIAYLVGTGMLVLGIIVQTVRHDLDSWLVLTLGAMILAKIFGIIYSQKNQ